MPRKPNTKPSPSELIARLKKRTVESTDELSARLKRAQREVAAKIEDLTERRAASTSKKEREKLFREITSIYEVLASEIDSWMIDQAEETAIEWHDRAQADIRTLTGNKVVVAYNRDHVRQQWQLIHGGNQRHLAAVFTDQMSSSDIRNLRRTLVDTFRQQSIEGWTARETHKNLQQKWDRLAKNLRGDRFVDATGRPWTNANYLEMLTQTTFARVSDESYVESITTAGYTLARIVDDGEPCAICQAWSGIIVDVSGNQNTHYPSRNQALDAGWKHPRCGCYLEAVIDAVDKEDMDRQRKTPATDWAKVDDVQDYNDRFKTQEKVDGGMTKREAGRDLKRDKLKREAMFAGFEFDDQIDRIDDAVIDQMDRKGIPRIVAAKKGDVANSSRNSSLGGVLYLDRDATDAGFRQAFDGLQTKRGAIKAPPIVEPTPAAFVPAKTVKEAEEWGTKNIAPMKLTGIQDVRVANKINEELYDLKTRFGAEINGIDVVDIEPNLWGDKPAAQMSTFTAGNANRQTQYRYLSLDRQTWESVDTLKGAAKNAAPGFVYNAKSGGIIRHEIGHILDAQNGSFKGEISQEIFKAWNPTKHPGVLSKYAETSAHEMTAEAFTLWIEEGAAGLESVGLSRLEPVFESWKVQK